MVLAGAEKTVGREGAVDDDAFLFAFYNGRANDFFFFIAQHTVFAGVRVEAHHGNGRPVFVEVNLECFVENLYFFKQ